MAFRSRFLLYGTALTVILCVLTLAWTGFAVLLGLHLILFAIGVFDVLQTKQTLRRNFPLVGHGRYIMETLRPKIYQYFVESDIDGRPFDRISRSIIYQRAKKEIDSSPFGTQLDVYETGYEWVNHSIHALDAKSLEQNPRILIGGPHCKKPYSASLLNISAMSYGSLSKTAVLALNGGAKDGSFYHNTGEGGLTPFHLENGGDVVWQIGTGYFGCRDAQGKFSPERFQEKALLDQVKMIEIKISQGAKPGHGGILPAKKNTPEIAAIRGVTPGEDVISPPFHSAFDTPQGLLNFIARLRELSNGKPVGFKLCIGRRSEFIAICKAMVQSGITADFITVDGGEGGTGAAPLEFANSVGMPLRDGLSFVHDCLVGFGLREHIRIVAAGKVSTAFHVFRTLALGADLCNSARGMMLALGCIQALECHKNTCPTGIATQNPELFSGINVPHKRERVKNFQKATVHGLVELMAAAGIKDHRHIHRAHVYRRVDISTIRRYDEIFQPISPGAFLKGQVADKYRRFFDEARAESFDPLPAVDSKSITS